VLYSAEVITIAGKQGFAVHAYADDLQLYGHSAHSDCVSLVSRMSSCVEEVKAWMASSRLRLNSSKTELIWLGAARYVKLCPAGPLLIAGALITPCLKVRDLGVMVDTDLSLKAHVQHVTSVCFFHIRQLRLVRRSLTFDAAHSLVRALVHSRLDYCNGILANAPIGLVNCLQSVLRTAARLVLRLPPWASVSQLIRDRLHWLPVKHRITHKLCTMAFKCTHDLAPAYLSRLCTSVECVDARARLRSATSGHLIVPVTRMSTLGRRGFYYACPAAWNLLPPALTADSSLTLPGFKNKLKSLLFLQRV